METLEIHNFLTIKDAKLEVRPFTVLIGPQASGKSVIAKLLFFFKNLLNTELIRTIQTNNNIDNLKENGIDTFNKIFPKYAWAEDEFNIIYNINGITISLIKEKSKDITIKVSDSFMKLLTDSIEHLNHKIEEHKQRNPTHAKDIIKNQVMRYNSNIKIAIYEVMNGSISFDSIFVPTGRSFFTNLQNVIFTLLLNDLDIDYLLKQFGSVLEASKSRYMGYKSNDWDIQPSNEPDNREIIDYILKEMNRILKGEYLFENNEDWIVIENRKKIKLINCSSGQQEVLPMLLVLVNTLIFVKSLGPIYFFCEEPEASLFPPTQKDLIEYFLFLQNKLKHSYVLTTHSPYVLVAINNAIMASNVIEEKGEEAKEAVSKVMEESLWIKYEDVMAYTIRDGVLESIMDEESRLIGASEIDSVSDYFDNVFGQLLDIRYAK